MSFINVTERTKAAGGKKKQQQIKLHDEKLWIGLSNSNSTDLSNITIV